MARTATLLRRSGRGPGVRVDDPVVRAAGISVDPERHGVRCDGRPVEWFHQGKYP